MAAVHDHRSFPALRLHVLLLVMLVVCCLFGFWQDPLGQDEFLGGGPGRDQPAHTGGVGVARPGLDSQLVGQVIDLPGDLLAERGEEPLLVADCGELPGQPSLPVPLGHHPVPVHAHAPVQASTWPLPSTLTLVTSSCR